MREIANELNRCNAFVKSFRSMADYCEQPQNTAHNVSMVIVVNRESRFVIVIFVAIMMQFRLMLQPYLKMMTVNHRLKEIWTIKTNAFLFGKHPRISVDRPLGPLVYIIIRPLFFSFNFFTSLSTFFGPRIWSYYFMAPYPHVSHFYYYLVSFFLLLFFHLFDSGLRQRFGRKKKTMYKKRKEISFGRLVSGVNRGQFMFLLLLPRS